MKIQLLYSPGAIHSVQEFLHIQMNLKFPRFLQVTTLIIGREIDSPIERSTTH